MKTLVRNFFSSLPFGTRLFLLIYALGLVAWLGVYLHWFNVYQWLALSPALVWKGQVWRVVSYAFLPNSPLDWILSLFWLATLVSILGRNFSALGFWTYSLLGALATALFILVLQPKWPVPIASCGGMTFALLVAWDRLYRRERLILLGIGEISVRQAVDSDRDHQLARYGLLFLVSDAGHVVRRNRRMDLFPGLQQTADGSKKRAGRIRTHREIGIVICAREQLSASASSRSPRREEGDGEYRVAHPPPHVGSYGRSAVARKRAATARGALADCHFCAHHCGVNRLAGEPGLCHAGAAARIFSAQVEVSDELELIPTFAIALSGCDLRCDFCITGAPSWNPARAATADAVAMPGGAGEHALADGARTVMIAGRRADDSSARRARNRRRAAG